MHASTPTVLAATLAVAACSRSPADHAHAMPPAAVHVHVARAMDVPITFEHLGRTEGSREVEIRARISGFLESRHFVEGSDVAAGALLFQLDGKMLQAQQRTAEAEVRSAEARLTQARREAARLQPLVAEQAVSQREYDDAASAATISTAELAAAQARLQQIEVDLGYTRVTAPIAGRIGRALRPEGSLVSPTADGLLTTLLQLDPIYVSFHRTESQQQRLELDLKNGRIALPGDGQFKVDVVHRDGSVLAIGGTIDFTDGRLDTMTGTIPMRATLANTERRLLAGQSVKVVLRGAVLRNAMTVPQRAVLEGPQGKFVMLAVAGKQGAGDSAEASPVEVGEWVDLEQDGIAARSWVITKGLADGARVIVDNLMRLRPGSPVQVTPPTGPDGAGQADSDTRNSGR